MENLLHDFRYAFRLLAKSPSFSAIAIITLALGIGANTAIFTVVNAVLLRPLPFRDSSGLMIVAEKSSFPIISTSYENYVDWRDQSHSFASLEATRGTTITLTGAGEPERLNARMVTAPLLPLLGVDAHIGRTFRADEDRAGGAPVVLLSYGLWQRRFGGATDVLGKSIDLDSRQYSIVGVLPRGFELLQPAEVFLPLTPWAATLPDDRNWHPGIIVVGRLKPGVTREQARTGMVTITKRLEQQYPDYNTGTSADVVPLQEQMVQNIRPALILLLGAVSFVLLIACANVANLLLSRAASRGREVAIRTSMGATRGRIIRQLLTESVLLSLAGGLLGLLFAWASLGPLLKISAGTVPQVFSVGLDRSVLIFTILVSVITGLVFGIAPALRTTKIDLRETLNEGSRGSTAGPRHYRLHGAAHFHRNRARHVAAGRIRPVLAEFLAHAGRLRSASRPIIFWSPIFRSRNPHMPGPSNATDSTTASSSAPERCPASAPPPRLRFFRSAAAVDSSTSTLRGHPPKTAHDYVAAGYRAVTANYFETLGVPLLQGRLIHPADNEKSPSVVVINAAMAHVYFPNENPLGKRMQIGATPDNQIPTMEIVGVVGDVTQGLGLEPKAEMYVPYQQLDQLLPIFQMSIVLRTAGDPHLQAAALRSALAEIDPNQPLVKVRTMEDNMAATVAQPRFRTWLIGIFAALALTLAAVGIYGVTSYSVTQRTSEIGIRVALGAQPADIFRILVGEGLRFALIGVAVGLVATLVLTRLLASFLYGVSASDPLIFSSVALLMIAISAAASFFPARRATRVDPVVALRHE